MKPEITYWDNGTIRSEEWRVNGERHRETGSAFILYSELGIILIEEWWVHGQQHRDGAPAEIMYDFHGNVASQVYRVNDIVHREDGPASIFYIAGTKKEERWMLNGKKHRLDGPALISYNIINQIQKTVSYIDNEIHNEFGPAVVLYSNGEITSEKYYLRNELVLEDDLPFIQILKSNNLHSKWQQGELTKDDWFLIKTFLG